MFTDASPVYLDEIVKLIGVMCTNNFLHLDLKLDNFMVVEGTLRVIDYEFAVHKENATEFDASDIEEFTESILDGLCLELLGFGIVTNSNFETFLGKVISKIKDSFDFQDDH